MSLPVENPFPERTAPPPTLPGQTPVEITPLHQMRRQQLHDLARAFSIPVEKDATKEQILPTLLAAEKKGVFREPPADPGHFQKATRSPDDPPFILEAQDKLVPDEINFRHLREMAKDHGINTFQMGAEQIKAELQQRGIL